MRGCEKVAADRGPEMAPSCPEANSGSAAPPETSLNSAFTRVEALLIQETHSRA